MFFTSVGWGCLRIPVSKSDEILFYGFLGGGVSTGFLSVLLVEIVFLWLTNTHTNDQKMILEFLGIPG